ncbi:hypothetical protein TNIN_328941 [Trichonephila inaurata madagascariensis]|uniref:Uncharacterized protein n=1 Tax=Trichonephila inaurata madagascariensis TaxID=2747483 RepID=A0A8X6WX68_9ARAC|nr:hypothetical protein TNIN_328941 [Trichonephila inaurata madagascariensis]
MLPPKPGNSTFLKKGRRNPHVQNLGSSQKADTPALHPHSTGLLKMLTPLRHSNAKRRRSDLCEMLRKKDSYENPPGQRVNVFWLTSLL